MKLSEVWYQFPSRRFLLLATVLAAAVAVPQALRQPQQWQATATAVVPITEDNLGPNAVSQLVTNYEALIRGSAGMARISRETQVPPGPLSKGLTVRQSGGGNVVEVSFRADRPDRSIAVVRAAARTGLVLLADIEGVQARETLRLAEGLHDQAQHAIDELTTRIRFPLPDKAFQLLASETVQLRMQLTWAQLDGQRDRARRLSRVLADREAKLSRLAKLVSQHEALVLQRNQLDGGVASARARLVLAKAHGAPATLASAVTVGAAERLPRLPALITSAARAALVNVLIVSGVLLVWASLRARRLSHIRSPSVAASGTVLQLSRSTGGSLPASSLGGTTRRLRQGQRA